MAVQVACTIRDYDPGSDTCTVELTGAGAIDTWISGVQIHVGVNRGWLSYGNTAVLSMPDVHALCQAAVVDVHAPPNLVTQTPTATQQGRYGRTAIGTNGAGAGSGSVTFSPAFTTAPTVSATADYRGTLTISAITVNGCTFTVSCPSVPNGTVYVTWYAQGT